MRNNDDNIIDILANNGFIINGKIKHFKENFGYKNPVARVEISPCRESDEVSDIINKLESQKYQYLTDSTGKLKIKVSKFHKKPNKKAEKVESRTPNDIPLSLDMEKLAQVFASVGFEIKPLESFYL
jgi:hypothetical protein